MQVGFSINLVAICTNMWPEPNVYLVMQTELALNFFEGFVEDSRLRTFAACMDGGYQATGMGNQDWEAICGADYQAEVWLSSDDCIDVWISLGGFSNHGY